MTTARFSHFVLATALLAVLWAASPIEVMAKEGSAAPDIALRGTVLLGDRKGALLAGGMIVYTGDVFTVTNAGSPQRLQVIQVAD